MTVAAGEVTPTAPCPKVELWITVCYIFKSSALCIVKLIHAEKPHAYLLLASMGWWIYASAGLTRKSTDSAAGIPEADLKCRSMFNCSLYSSHCDVLKLAFSREFLPFYWLFVICDPVNGVSVELPLYLLLVLAGCRVSYHITTISIIDKIRQSKDYKIC